MNSKSMIVGLVLVSGLSLGAAPVFAVGPNGTAATANQATRITNLQIRANTAIDNRVTRLNQLIDRINGIKRLTTDQKTTLSGQIQTEISNLQALKVKIDADTDLATLRTDVQSVVKSYRVYVVFIPKIYIIAHGDRLMDVVSALQTYEGKLQARVTNAGSPSGLTSLLADMTAKLTDANAQAQNAINAVLPLTPDGWPGNKATLQSARTMLQTARQDIQAAWHDAQQIRQGLPKTKSTPTPTP